MFDYITNDGGFKNVSLNYAGNAADRFWYYEDTCGKTSFFF